MTLCNVSCNWNQHARVVLIPWAWLLLIFSLAIRSVAAAEAIPVVYSGEHRVEFALELLTLALKADGGQYKPKPHGVRLPRGRDFRLLNQNREIDVLWGSATRERETRLLPVRIPIYRGMIGWRIAVVKRDSQDMFSGITTLEQLKQLVPGQVHAWTDTRILGFNGIKVEKGTSTDSLYRMLKGGRFDYFPRSIMEVWHEYEDRTGMGFHIDEHALIHYPSAYYFYVNRSNNVLAVSIENGLETLIKTGEYEQLFFRHYGDILARARMHKRRVFSLQNPYLTDKTPLRRSELWLDPHVVASEYAGN
ncbi:amino acid ABC transporter substrate-binding protein [Pseudomaricurvus alkylphenolicus]|uniref:substrate-binding periplasmic protein n=1 Tax=Pseudomaricurvus alkylphenolicus TaxID=1306991 RepID=UPI00141EBF7B|nr:transporter substrate-binding domain-containing protein [Pseudomaricurvus alkylphenolicus]NIB40202.1 amino acid ABC transporter substrate-binding protein [Pseudomaricurvus alkylphenolicus]